MADIQKLIGSESPLELGQKINEIIENGGGGLEIGDIGIAPLGIDETQGKRRYLNGQLIIQDQYVEFTNKVKSAIELYPSLACTESEWQTTATMSTFGACGKFVVDNNAGTIRLPKITGFIQGLTDLSKLANLVEAGLPNITGEVVSAGSDGVSGAFSVISGQYKAYANSSTAQNRYVDFDASRSSSIYGKSSTVQPEAIQYPYFIQVATGAETEDNIINEIELNNPFSLLDYKYSEYELNNISWLRSNGQWNSKSVYPAVYELLLKIYNGTETKAGVSVKLSTGSYTDYDFVLNTAEETFRLPIKVKQKFYNNIAPVTGNGMSLGLTNGSETTGLIQGGTAGIISRENAYGVTVGTSVTGSAISGAGAIGLTTDATKSGIEAHLSESTNLYLYFYVGETVQNANLINAGRIEEKVAYLIPDNSSVIASYGMPSNKLVNLELGASGTQYTAPANGYFYLNKRKTAQTQYIALVNETALMGVWSNGNPGAASGMVYTYIPAKKGDIVTISYTASGDITYFHFIYAEGEV